MKNILVPCDFSRSAVNAFRFAMNIAQKSKAVVHLLNVVELPVIHDPVIMPVLTFEKDFMMDLRKKTDREFEKIISKHKPASVTVKSHVSFGSPFSMIDDFIRRKKVDLVIMGSQGASGARGYFIGSNAEKVVRRSTAPVLVIKDYPKGPIKNIVFPHALDGEKQGKLIERVKDLQAFFRAKLHILYVNTPTNFTADNITMEKLKQFAKEFGFRNYTLNVYNYPFADMGIIQFTNSIKGDLVAMRTHGRRGLAHFLNGSIAEDVVNHAKFPIWTFSIPAA